MRCASHYMRPPPADGTAFHLMHVVAVSDFSRSAQSLVRLPHVRPIETFIIGTAHSCTVVAFEGERRCYVDNNATATSVAFYDTSLLIYATTCSMLQAEQFGFALHRRRKGWEELRCGMEEKSRREKYLGNGDGERRGRKAEEKELCGEEKQKDNHDLSFEERELRTEYYFC